VIVFMGVAGAGKSVQGKLLADDLGYRWLSTGEFLRMHISGKRRQEMLEGKLLDDDEIISILNSFLATLAPNEACILDGFPRTITQSKWLLDQHDTGKIHVSAIIHLKASKDVVKQRLLARGRPDDTEEAINKRFEEYENSTLPIVEWFKGDKIPVYEVNGERQVEEIHKEILSLIGADKK
jgi:adenylate kinase